MTLLINFQHVGNQEEQEETEKQDIENQDF